MYVKIAFFTMVFLIFLSLFSGCTDILNDIPTKYELNPTKISYDISYGYQVECTGYGKYEINYNCDIPESMKTNSFDLLYKRDYNLSKMANNSYVKWNISGKNNATYELGITANIESESYLVSDLNGENALTIQEISHFFPKIVEQYTNPQSNKNITLIDPYDLKIKAVTREIFNKTEDNNSFVVAKLLFIWLKENTNYNTHNDKGSVQPATVTLQKRTGDCDDLSFLYISLCRAVGIPSRFIRGYLIKNEVNGSTAATAHAWAEVFVGKAMGNEGWITVECACCTQSIQADINQNFGVEDAFHLRLFIDDGSNESLNISLSGIHVQYYENVDVKLNAFANVENYLELDSKQLLITKDDKRYYQ